MRKIAQFEKVSYTEFERSVQTMGSEKISDICGIYEAIVLPKRATAGSAGYDFVSTSDVYLQPGESVTIPTGIRVRMEEGWVLMIYPRSGLGFRYRMQLANTVGVIDSDYYYSDNEGHIMIKITNDSREEKALRIQRGEAFAQGVFTEFGITVDDAVKTIRNGGFGSTSPENKKGL